MRISKWMLCGTILTGVLYFIVGEWLYNTWKESLPMPLLIGLYFLGLSLFVIAGISIVVAFTYRCAVGYGDIVLRCILLCLAVLASAVVFEFMYELCGKEHEVTPDSYVFLMDSSGSMAESDPENKRYEAIQSVLEGRQEEFPFAVYSFANDSSLVRPMEPISQGTDFQMDEPDGGTAIGTVLTKLYEDIEAGKIDVGENGKVLLFSDGRATDMRFFRSFRLRKVLKHFAKAGVSISTVGLGKPDDTLMGMIAGKTGGIYISVDDASQLNEAMQEAVSQKSSRNLLGYRNETELNFIYVLIRFVAIAVIGLLLAGIKTFICEPVLDTQPVLLTSLAGSVLAAICVEFGMNMLGLFPWLMRLFMCVLLAAATLYEGRRYGMNDGSQYENL